MTHQKISRTVAASVTSLGLVMGLAGVAGASATNGTVSHTGYDSSNVVRSTEHNHTTVTNRNSAHLTNNNPQWASTGRVESEKNTTAGSARSGNATNTSTMRASVTYTNSGAGGSGGGGSTSNTTTGNINNTGADSTNKVVSKTTNNTTVTNDNDVCVTNNNWQAASSGSVESEKNTTAGDAVSGNASNTSNAEFTISYKN